MSANEWRFRKKPNRTSGLRTGWYTIKCSAAKPTGQDSRKLPSCRFCFVLTRIKMKDIVMHALLALYIFGIKSCQGLAFDQANVDTGFSGTGTGGGIQCPADGCPVHCHANDDPHMFTFDGSGYEMQQEGKFYLYKHSTQPIWVQGFFQSCGYPGAFCSCGAAVRYFDEIFVLDKCLKPNGVRANVIAKLGTGTSLRVSAYFAGYKISVPGPLRVFLGSHALGIGTINLQTNPTDLQHVGGLCGYYDGFPSNDFTWSTGQITPASTTHPDEFADSWRVPLNEDLFIGQNLDNLAPCIEVANTTYVPQGVADACFLNITPSAFTGPFFEGLPLPLNRRKRQIGRDFPNGEWPNGWTAAQANSFCSNYLFSSPAAEACVSNIPVFIDANPFVESCARDIQLTGETSFAAVTLTALLSKCVATLEAYGISNGLIEQNLCPFNCSGHGVCVSGACVCDQGWYGLSCSQSINEVPSITNTSPLRTCPSPGNGTRCYTADLYGGPFVNSSTLSVRGLAYQVNNPLVVRKVSLKITIDLFGVIRFCILLLKCSWPRDPFVLMVSVSNDGLSYSAPASIAFN